MPTLIMKCFRKCFRQLSSSHLSPSHSVAGFTLTELLVGVSLTGIMLSMAGVGLVAVLQKDKAEESETTRRTALNRALDFISEDVRMAKSIATPVSIPSQSCGSTAGVLDLTMPDNRKVIYYVHDMSGCSVVWAKPIAIRRVESVNGTLQASTDTILVDAIKPPTARPSCAATETKGFYACLSGTRSATLYLYGKLTNAYSEQSNTYEVTSQVSARSF